MCGFREVCASNQVQFYSFTLGFYSTRLLMDTILYSVQNKKIKEFTAVPNCSISKHTGSYHLKDHYS
jgi:hypothetical protein